MALTATIIEGDCIYEMAKLPDASVDVCITDLPYGITACKWDAVIPFEPMWKQVKRVCKPNTAILLFGSQPFSSALVMSNPMMFKHEWIWIKNAGSNFANTVREPMKEHEAVLMFSQGKWTYNKQMQERTGGGAARVRTPVRHNTTQSEVYREFSDRPPVQHDELRVPSSWQKFNRERGFHPTQKPVALLRYFIRTYSNEGDTVLDFTCGSGSTGVAALMENRNFIGIDNNAEYVAVAKQRISDLQLKLTV